MIVHRPSYNNIRFSVSTVSFLKYRKVDLPCRCIVCEKVRVVNVFGSYSVLLINHVCFQRMIAAFFCFVLFFYFTNVCPYSELFGSLQISLPVFFFVHEYQGCHFSKPWTFYIILPLRVEIFVSWKMAPWIFGGFARSFKGADNAASSADWVASISILASLNVTDLR